MVKRFLENAAKSNLPIDVLMRDAPIMMHSIDHEGVLLNVSTMWANRLGYEPPDMIGKQSIDFLTPDSRREALEKYIPQFWETGRMVNVRYRFLTVSNEVVPVIMSAQAIEDAQMPRSIAVIFDNGYSKLIYDMKDSLDKAVSNLEDVSDAVGEDDKKKLEDVIAELRRTQID